MKESFNPPKGILTPGWEPLAYGINSIYFGVLYVRMFPGRFNWEWRSTLSGTLPWTRVLGWIRKEKSSWTPAIPFFWFFCPDVNEQLPTLGMTRSAHPWLDGWCLLNYEPKVFHLKLLLVGSLVALRKGNQHNEIQNDCCHVNNHEKLLHVILIVAKYIYLMPLISSDRLQPGFVICLEDMRSMLVPNPSQKNFFFWNWNKELKNNFSIVWSH